MADRSGIEHRWSVLPEVPEGGRPDFYRDDTPLTSQREPDMSYVVGSAQKIRDRLRRGQLVVLAVLGVPIAVFGLGYLAHGPKEATLVTDATEPVGWELVSGGATVASGKIVT